jgi:hypothetical protein
MKERASSRPTSTTTSSALHDDATRGRAPASVSPVDGTDFDRA